MEEAGIGSSSLVILKLSMPTPLPPSFESELALLWVIESITKKHAPGNCLCLERVQCEQQGPSVYREGCGVWGQSCREGHSWALGIVCKWGECC